MTAQHSWGMTEPTPLRQPLPQGTQWCTALLVSLKPLCPYLQTDSGELANTVLHPEMQTTAFEATLQSCRLLSEAANINTRDIHTMAAAFDMLIAPGIVMPCTSIS